MAANRWVLWVSRWLLGGVFLWAAWPKLLDQAAFAAAINNYHLVPESLLPLFATCLAGVEAIVAVALLVGLWRRGANVAVCTMLVMFVVALAIAYAQGRSIDCGCFVADLSAARAEDIRAHMLRRIIEDLGMLVLGINLVIQSFSKSEQRGSSSQGRTVR